MTSPVQRSVSNSQHFSTINCNSNNSGINDNNNNGDDDNDDNDSQFNSPL